MNIYLDYNATTPIHPDVKKVLIDSLNIYGNPSSLHDIGKQALFKIEETRENIKQFINSRTKDQIIFTASATEANNIIIKGLLLKYINETKKPHLITSSIEHPSVLNTFKYLEQLGFPVTFVNVNKNGIVDLVQLENSIQQNTKLISIHLANNEIGTIQPLKQIIAIAKKYNILVHSDAVQGLGKIKIDVKDLQVDFMSFSSHKVYGPKGLGFLFANKKRLLSPIMQGGGHEFNIRSGTENTSAIIAFDKCISLLSKNMDSFNKRIKVLRDLLEEGIIDVFPKARINGDRTLRLPNTISASFYPMEANAIMLSLNAHGVYVSTGSACSSKHQSSYVLKALDKQNKDLIHNAIRFSLGYDTSKDHILYTIKTLSNIIKELKQFI